MLGLVDYDNPKSLVNALRRKRGRRLKALIDGIADRKERVEIIDLGGTPRYWNMLGTDYLKDRNVLITLINEGRELSNPDGFHCISDDACELSQYPDNAFDLVHSNSVIEHVGDWARMTAFAHETRRLAPVYYIQTPYFWFPVEPHYLTPFFHWMPERWRAGLLSRRHLGHRKKAPNFDSALEDVRSVRLLKHVQMAQLFPDAEITFEMLGPFPKSIIAVRS